MNHTLISAMLFIVILFMNSETHAQKTIHGKIKVPYSPGEENVYIQHVYKETGTLHSLRLLFTTPFKNDTQEGAKTYKIWYQISTDGEKTYDKIRPLIQKGAGFDQYHPIRPVYIPKNSFISSAPPPLRASNGEIMVPFTFWPLDDQGKLFEHKDAWSFSDAGVLIGKWIKDGSEIEWDLGNTIHLNMEQSTRGSLEPALIELTKPGKFLMIVRASNSARSDMPSYKWKCVSEDFCRTWSLPTPFTYSKGEIFFSPSSCSDILRNSLTKKIYWIGNICTDNAQGNLPRYPLIIGQIDEETLGLIKETVKIIDTRDLKKDSPNIQLSNFKISEDSETGDFIITLPRIDYQTGKREERQWQRMRYRVGVKGPNIIVNGN